MISLLHLIDGGVFILNTVFIVLSFFITQVLVDDIKSSVQLAYKALNTNLKIEVDNPKTI